MTDEAYPDLTGLEGTDVAVKTAALLAAEPWFASEIAGLQFYDYGKVDELTGERVLPLPGDRLHLVREPANPHDENAVQVWWRNSRMLGHLPRYTALRIAPLLDAGAAARAYVHHPGDGEAWSLRALVVGPAAETIHGRFIQHLADAAMCRSDAEIERDRILRDRAEQNRLTLRQQRRQRLRTAVDVLRHVPSEPMLPEPNAQGRTDVDDLADVLRCSRSTVVRIAASVGIALGRWDYTVDVTPEFREALLEWDRKPKRGGKLPKLKGTLGFREFYAEPDTGGSYARSW
ncbi:HIRAN domain-containing protein [Methylobacterium sp. 391_Methyba4]|uniref:HIRAN domain-containing protein n=1 Tax=Methylobacterium sp. 391_Methyba4 TaxID=3038924 RepID=UPI00241D8D5B|nr:HIRAN domain-containing protein [Methylobacterium sp. 391_Methyba4]WFS05481.1 HIRAN domain-containing protein [Methylobacterium sp. 391_Methyba4]